MKKIAVAALVLTLLAGCAGSRFDLERRHEHLLAYTGADAGTVIVSEGGEGGGHFDRSGVTYSRVGTEDLGSFAFAIRKMFGTPEHDFQQSSVIGQVQVVRLPPGEYVFVSAWGVQYVNSGYFPRALPPTARFTVRSGETTYLGRYVIGERSYSPRVYVSDKRDEDLAIAARKTPGLDPAAVTSQVPPEGHRQL